MASINWGILQPTKQLGIQDVFKPLSAVEQLQTIKAGMSLQDMYKERAYKDEIASIVKQSSKQQGIYDSEAERIPGLKKKQNEVIGMMGNTPSSKSTLNEFDAEIKKIEALRPASLESSILKTQLKHGMTDRYRSFRSELVREADTTLRMYNNLVTQGTQESLQYATKIIKSGMGALQAVYPDLNLDEFNEVNTRGYAAFVDELKAYYENPTKEGLVKVEDAGKLSPVAKKVLEKERPNLLKLLRTETPEAKTKKRKEKVADFEAVEKSRIKLAEQAKTEGISFRQQVDKQAFSMVMRFYDTKGKNDPIKMFMAGIMSGSGGLKGAQIDTSTMFRDSGLSAKQITEIKKKYEDQKKELYKDYGITKEETVSDVISITSDTIDEALGRN